MFADHRRHTDLLRLLVLREVRVRYARTALGAAWALFVPVSMLCIFVMLNFGRLLSDASPYRSVPYVLFAYCGLLPWVHFSSSLTQSTPSLASSRDMLKKSAFPREFIPLAKPLACLLDLGIGAVLLIALLMAHSTHIGITVVAVPVVFMLQFVFTAGLCLLLSAGNLFFRDVQYILQPFLLLGMFITSVLYPADTAGGGFAAVLALNPMTSYIDSYREALLLGVWPWRTLLAGAVGALVSGLTGCAVFQRLSPRFAEEV
jgi:lipopolysaccharide transport system permease protein